MYLTFKIMPTSPDIDLKELEEKVKSQLEELGGKFSKSETQPVAFGLKALLVTFMFDESVSTDELEEKLSENEEEINSISVVDMRRAFG